MVKRFEVYLVNLDELPSKDPKNTRPAVVVSCVKPAQAVSMKEVCR